MKGRFITFEGIDGAGKSTHIGWYVERLRALGREVVHTREPGGSALAESLRELLLQRPMPLASELLLVFAARQDHLEQRIRPALAAGKWVVCDRFTDSTYAYQGAGRGAPLERIAWLEAWVHGDLQPDRTYLFDLDPALAAQRRAAHAPDRFEAEDTAFFERVRQGYRRRAAADPERFRILGSDRSLEILRELLEEDIVSICK
ncbi:MAG: dTMP kinase [Burkholderiales bacterium]|nr:dTMP kinase [Burkholderiales bacterium]OJX06633.1 MAG: dTMP kinase [Burkholderiales bacterium 70-64]